MIFLLKIFVYGIIFVVEGTVTAGMILGLLSLYCWLVTEWKMGEFFQWIKNKLT
jgi:hypothetical protein